MSKGVHPIVWVKGKRFYKHFCKYCKAFFLDKSYWVTDCPVCKKDYTKGLGHMIRNAIYGERRHPKAVKEE